jgi:multidrug efflux pump subunit AcrB
MNLAKYSLDNTKIVYFFLAVLLIGGILSFGRLGKKEDAPFVIKSAVIMTRYPGAEPAEVERLVTEPISREIQSMSGVYKIKSESMYGLSKITFELQPSLSAASIPQKWDELRRKVLNIQPQLPAGSSVPTVSDDFGDVFGIYYGLVGDDGFSYEEMRNWAERIKTQVITADGVMKVALFGTQTEVIHIFISVNKLAGMGIDPKQLASLLQSQNQIINTGEISAGEQQLRIVANGTTRLSMISATRLSLPPADKSSWATSPSLKRDTWNLPAISCTSTESAPSVSASPPTRQRMW